MTTRGFAIAMDVAAGVVFAVSCAALFRFTGDDAFIVQRYASQFVEGHGLVFNIGERILALTSPLQALLLSAFTVLLAFPMTAYKILGGTAVLVTLLYAGRRLFTDLSERALFFSATLASPFVAMWSVGGLETPLLLACVTVLVVLALPTSSRVATGPQLFLFFVLCAVAFLLRHDSIVFVLPLAIAVFAKDARQSLPGVLAGSLAGGAWLLFAWIYYGDVLPTSFYAKALENRHPFLGGIGYELSFVVLCILPVTMVRWPRLRGISTAAWASIVLFAIAAAAFGRVHMMFGYRFYVPMLPALVAYYMRVSSPLNRVARWAFVLPLAVNLALFVIVYSRSVNPTIFHPALIAPHYGFLHRLEKRGFAYEYPNEPASKYGDFIDALRRSGRAVLADAEARGISRSARMATIIAGATSVEIPDVYVYDNNLVGVRRNCPTLNRREIYSAADYIELMVPRHGSVIAQIGPLTSTVIPVSDFEFEFDGVKEHIVIYFNPLASHTPVPAKLRDPCPPGRGDVISILSP